MVCCWVSAYTVLPAGLSLFERWGWIKVRPEPALVGWSERALPQRARGVLAVGLPLFLVVAAGAWRYLTHGPLETNLRHLASTGAELNRATVWMDRRSPAATRSRRWSAACGPSTKVSPKARVSSVA
jgi:hypothetical protein